MKKAEHVKKAEYVKKAVRFPAAFLSAVLVLSALFSSGCGASGNVLKESIVSGLSAAGSAADGSGTPAENAVNADSRENVYAGITGDGSDDSPAEWTGMYFDTVISLRIYGDNAAAWMRGAIDICADMEDTLSAQKESAELYALNHRTEQTVTVSDDLAECIREGLLYSAMSEGTFDITILPVKELWDFESEDHKGSVPDEAVISEELKKVDYRKVHVDDDNNVTFDSPDTMIDLGGIAKGYISAKLAGYLQNEGCVSALINLGGNVRTIGTKPDGSDWVVGIQEPFSDRGEILTTLDSHDEAVISSGTYERYFISGGKLYHHILDPATGFPADSGLNQATVIGTDDAMCDALATIAVAAGEYKTEEIISANGLDVKVMFADTDNEMSWYPEE